MNFLGDETTATGDSKAIERFSAQIRKQAQYEQELAARAELCEPGLGKRTETMKTWNKVAGWSMLGLIAANIFTKKKKKG